ncbi:hypothetical protein MYX82_02350 [Acidobacteria bacterium AH-259-D05]|nr:hypothetical protein [Acidobacteria bacterium AH-259-D05]
MIGTTISHYKVIEKIGQGDMGEVYLAEDSRLDRKVALKIFPQHLSERADLRERMVDLYKTVVPIAQEFCDAGALSSALDDVRSHRGGDLNLVVPTGISRAEFVQEVDYAEVH